MTKNTPPSFVPPPPRVFLLTVAPRAPAALHPVLVRRFNLPASTARDLFQGERGLLVTGDERLDVLADIRRLKLPETVVDTVLVALDKD